MPAQTHGIEVKIGWRDTRSPKFAEILAAQRRNQSAEEMRIFYVGITRAKQSLIMLGSNPTISPTITEPQNWNSWQDPIWAAKEVLVDKGAVFTTA